MQYFYAATGNVCVCVCVYVMINITMQNISLLSIIILRNLVSSFPSLPVLQS